MSNAFVCLMGIGTVFIGLICIVFLCMAMSAICQKLQSKQEVTQPLPTVSATPVAIPNRGELVAAIAVALAEEIGTDVSGIRIVSLKQV